MVAVWLVELEFEFSHAHSWYPESHDPWGFLSFTHRYASGGFVVVVVVVGGGVVVGRTHFSLLASPSFAGDPAIPPGH